MNRLILCFNSSFIYVALGAASLTVCNFILTGQEIVFPYVFLVFFVTWSAYLFLNPIPKPYYSILVIIAAIGTGLASLFASLPTICFLSIPAVLVLIYSLKWLEEVTKKKFNFGLRCNGLLKLVAICISWTLLVSFLVFLNLSSSNWQGLLLFTSASFAYIAALSLASDVRDSSIDIEFKTMAQRLGKSKSIQLIVILIIFSSALSIGAIENLDSMGFVSIIISDLLAIGIVFWSTKMQNWQLQTLALDTIMPLKFFVCLFFI